jgi:hypothetical protein
VMLSLSTRLIRTWLNHDALTSSGLEITPLMVILKRNF